MQSTTRAAGLVPATLLLALLAFPGPRACLAAGFADLESQVRQFTLPNGLTFLVLERPEAPVFWLPDLRGRGRGRRGGRHHRPGPHVRAHGLQGDADASAPPTTPRRPRRSTRWRRPGAPWPSSAGAGSRRTPRAWAPRGGLQAGAGGAPAPSSSATTTRRSWTRTARSGSTPTPRWTTRSTSTAFPSNRLRALGAPGRGPAEPARCCASTTRSARSSRRSGASRSRAPRAALLRLVDHELPRAPLRQRPHRPSLGPQGDHPPRGRGVLPRALHGEEHGRRLGGGRRSSPR